MTDALRAGGAAALVAVLGIAFTLAGAAIPSEFVPFVLGTAVGAWMGLKIAGCRVAL